MKGSEMDYGWLRRIVSRLRHRAGAGAPFTGSRAYWEERYARGGHSGRGSSGELAAFKAEFLNTFVREQGVVSVIEFGCGDGSQLSLAQYPGYIGLDVAKPAVVLCRQRFSGDSTKSFFLYDPDAFVDRHGIFRADLALSLDVIYHLVEDQVFEDYMRHLFHAAERYVIVYSSDADISDPEPHIKHRSFTRWVERHLPQWQLRRRLPNPHQVSLDHRSGSFADFFVFQRA